MSDAIAAQSPLSDPRMEDFIRLMVEDIPMMEIIEQTEISRATAYRWRARPDVQKAYRDEMKGRLTTLLPKVISRISTKVDDPRVPLLALTKTAEFIADRIGLISQEPDDRQTAGLQISINLGPDEEDKDSRIAELEAKIAILTGQQVDGTAEDITDA
jgi:hypothetical protein